MPARREVAEVVGRERRRAAAGRCWSARCGGRSTSRRSSWIVVGDQPVDRRGRRTPRRSARSCARSRRNMRPLGRLAERVRAVRQRPPGGVGDRRRRRTRATRIGRRQRQPRRVRSTRHERRRCATASAGAGHMRARASGRRRLPSLGAIGGHPLEQVAARDEQAEQRAHDGVEHDHALVGRKTVEKTAWRALRRERCRARRASARAAERPRPAAERRADLDVARETRARAAPSVGPRASAIPAVPSSPRTNSSTSAGGIRLRRRLSRIFQRAISGRVLRTTARRWRRAPCARASARSASRRAPSDAGARANAR